MAFDKKYDTDIPLGKESSYQFEYDASILFPIARKAGRDAIGLNDSSLPFQGFDRWTAFELSWLDAKGKPCVAIAEFDFDAKAPHIIESKSFKLYLNSFNQTQISTKSELRQLLSDDLSKASGAKVTVRLFAVNDYPRADCADLSDDQAIYLDSLDVACDIYQTDVSLLKAEPSRSAKQSYQFDAFRSLCPVTSQPDWASVFINIDSQASDLPVASSLLRYLVSYRNHQGFHEQCVEQIFTDLHRLLPGAKITVYARFLRRGGLDINPIRSNSSLSSNMAVLARQ